MENTGHIYIAVIFLPLVAAIVVFLIPRAGSIIGLTTSCAVTVLLAVWIGPDFKITESVYWVGGWQPPLGIVLQADGFSATMLLMTSIVGIAVGIYASAYFSNSHTHKMGSKKFFWPLWLMLWSALNALFLTGDIFNIYVTLELVSLSAVALVAIAGGHEAKNAALRYLLTGLFGSLCYLLGVGLLYSRYATLEFAALSSVIDSSPLTVTTLALMTAGLMMKAALFPMHFWLPPAHSSAPAPVSALLSALVVKAAVYLLLRFWLDMFHPIVTDYGAQFIGVLGAAAVIWGSLQALRAQRFKLLVAYSTVAQIGYFFLAVPLSRDVSTSVIALSGAVFMILSHALAKSAMFTTAGTIIHVAGHDKISDLAGISQSNPVTVFAIAVAGVTLIGLPPSGAFTGKWLMLEAALRSGQWWWVVIILVGSLLAAGYVFRIISHAFTHLSDPPQRHPVDWRLEWPALAIAILALMLGLFAYPITGLMNIAEVLDNSGMVGLAR